MTIADHTMDQFNLAIYSGLYATYLYMQKAYPHLKETKGSVVNFASGAGLFGNYGQCSYAAAKEGIRGLTRVAANEWGKDGINVNIVCPLAWTAALENFQDAYPEAFKANVHMPPAGHYGDVEKEIGRVVVQLCGPDFKYMNGETVTLEAAWASVLRGSAVLPNGGPADAARAAFGQSAVQFQGRDQKVCALSFQDFSLLAAQRPALNHPLRGWRQTALQSHPSDRY